MAHRTIVRELPCLHVFHPDCIDPFLEGQSSLCPLCKASALPQGYVPPSLTNATVRRERNLRRMRARVDAGGEGGGRRWWSWIRLGSGRDGRDGGEGGAGTVEMREEGLSREEGANRGEGAGRDAGVGSAPVIQEEEERRPKCRC